MSFKEIINDIRKDRIAVIIVWIGGFMIVSLILLFLLMGLIK